MKLSNFEKHIKTRISGMEEEVDVDQLMNAILPIPLKKSRKAAYWSFFSLLAAAAISMSALYLYPATINDHQLSGIDELEKAEFMTGIDVGEYVNSSNLNTGKIVSTLETARESEIVLKSIYKESKLKKIRPKKLSELHENRKTTSFARQAVMQYNSNETLLVDNIVTKMLVTKEKDNAYMPHNQLASYKSHLKTESLHAQNLTELNIPVLNNLTGITPKYVDCPTFAENPWIYDLGMVMGLSKPNKTLSGKTQESMSALTSRANNEKSLEGLDLELYLSAKRARWPMFLKTGINYSRWSERMKIEKDYTEVDTIQGIISITTSQSGDTVKYIYGDVFVERDIQIRKSIHYYINRIDIPVSVVFEKEVGSSAFQVEAGTKINVANFARGLLYQTDTEFTALNQSKLFNSLTGLSYFGKLHYRYYFKKDRYIGSSAYYQYLPSEFSTQSNSIGQKYSNFGLGLYYGMRF